MRFVTCLVGGAERAGLVDGDDIRLFAPGVALIDRLDDLGAATADLSDERVPMGGAHLLAPIPRPPTVRDFYAFEQHVRDGPPGRAASRWNPTGTSCPSSTSPTRRRSSARRPRRAPPGRNELDYELEVAAVVGRGGTTSTPSRATTHIAGFTAS